MVSDKKQMNYAAQWGWGSPAIVSSVIAVSTVIVCQIFNYICTKHASDLCHILFSFFFALHKYVAKLSSSLFKQYGCVKSGICSTI